MKIRELNASTYSVEPREKCEHCEELADETCTACVAGEEALYNRMLEAAQHFESAKFQLRGDRLEIIF